MDSPIVVPILPVLGLKTLLLSTASECCHCRTGSGFWASAFSLRMNYSTVSAATEVSEGFILNLKTNLLIFCVSLTPPLIGKRKKPHLGDNLARPFRCLLGDRGHLGPPLTLSPPAGQCGITWAAGRPLCGWRRSCTGWRSRIPWTWWICFAAFGRSVWPYIPEGSKNRTQNIEDYLLLNEMW